MSENESEKRETLAEIVAEMKRTKYGGEDCSVKWCLREWADRIDAAWRREKSEIESDALAVGGIVEAERHKECGTPTTEESSAVGNAAALREALVEALNKVNDAYDILSKPCVALEEVRQACREARGIIIPALSLPPRNCDVGTPEEQAERFRAFCNKGKLPQFSESAYCAHECSCRDAADCKFAWAQTPYEAEEGGAE